MQEYSEHTTTQRLCSIGLRLIAIFYAIQIITSIPGFFYSFSVPQPQASTLTRTIMIAPFLINILMIIILWFYANSIANLMLAGHSNTTPQPSHNIQHTQLATTIFAAVGVWIFLVTFPELIVWLCKFSEAIIQNRASYPMPYPAWLDLLALLLKTGASILLICKTQSMLNFISRRK